MAPPGQQEPPESNLGRAGGKAVLETLGASQARPPIGQPPSGRDACLPGRLRRELALERPMLPEDVLTLCVFSLALDRLACALGDRGNACETMRR